MPKDSFDPSRVWRWIHTAPKDGTLVEIRGSYADATDPDDAMWYAEGWYEASPADRRWYDAATNEPCRPEEWRPLLKRASVSDEHPAGEACQRGGVAETSEATPQQSPSPTTETDPPMSVEEAREVLSAINSAFGTPEIRAEFLRWCGGAKADAEADRIEMALRILAPSDAPSTTEADR